MGGWDAKHFISQRPWWWGFWIQVGSVTLLHEGFGSSTGIRVWVTLWAIAVRQAQSWENRRNWTAECPPSLENSFIAVKWLLQVTGCFLLVKYQVLSSSCFLLVKYQLPSTQYLSGWFVIPLLEDCRRSKDTQNISKERLWMDY